MATNNVAFRGAIEFAGFPVNVALYTRVKKQRNESFRNIAPSGLPVKSQSIDPADGSVVTDPRKGVEVGKDAFKVLTPEALEQIGSGVKTTVAKPAQFSPVDSIAWDLAIDRFAVRPDDKVAGADQSVNIVWNGLRDSGLAYVTQVSLTGGHDAILALYATDNGFWAALLPFEDELYDVPTYAFEDNAQAAALFAQVAEARYEEQIGPFDHPAYKSEYRARRKAAIAAVLAGEEVEVQAPAAQASAAPDLMAVLAAAMSEAKPKAKAKKTAAKVAA